MRSHGPGGGRASRRSDEATIRDLHAKIGELTVERDSFLMDKMPCAAMNGRDADDADRRESSTQNPHILRTFLAQTLGLGEDRVRAIAPDVGGGFGAKINIYGEEYVAAALSRRLGLPIKWIEDRSESGRFAASSRST